MGRGRRLPRQRGRWPQRQPELDPADIDEQAIAAELQTHDLPELDLLIRTSGRFGCPTSCCGRRPMPSCCSPTPFGRTSTSRPLPKRSTIMPRASAGSVADERARRPHHDGVDPVASALIGAVVAAPSSPCWWRLLPRPCSGNGRGSRGAGASCGTWAASFTRCFRRSPCCGFASGDEPGSTC